MYGTFPGRYQHHYFTECNLILLHRTTAKLIPNLFPDKQFPDEKPDGNLLQNTRAVMNIGKNRVVCGKYSLN